MNEDLTKAADGLRRLAGFLVDIGESERYVMYAASGAAAIRIALSRLEEAERLTRSIPDDELVLGNYGFHMERMDDDHIWMQAGGYTFDLKVKHGKIVWMPQVGDWPNATPQPDSSQPETDCGYGHKPGGAT